MLECVWTGLKDNERGEVSEGATSQRSRLTRESGDPAERVSTSRARNASSTHLY